MQYRNHKIILIAVFSILIITYMIWKTTSNKPTFNKEGYGGYTSSNSKNADSAKHKDPLQPAFNAYNSGNYKKAETYAQQIVDTMSQSKDLAQRNTSVRARKVLAFSAARRKDLKLAQERFAVMKTEASKLPDKGKQEAEIGKLGHVSEDETGLIYMRARYMDPVLGKFVNEDPAQNDLNWFVYASNNPVNFIDQNGKTIVQVIAIILIVALLAFFLVHEVDDLKNLFEHIDFPNNMPRPAEENNLESVEYVQNFIDNLKTNGGIAEKIFACNVEIALYILEAENV